MDGDRLRISCNPDYVHSVGLTVFAFARLEWSVVWCCETIEPGCIHTLPEKTAGAVASKFEQLAPKAPDDPRKAELIKLAARFRALKDVRNGIQHAKPITDEDGAQRLYRGSAAWTIETLNRAADDFVECDIALNRLFHEYLKK